MIRLVIFWLALFAPLGALHASTPVSGSDLLRRLQIVADARRFDDTAFIARTLGVTFERSPDTRFGEVCGATGGIRSQTAEHYELKAGSLASTANGVAELQTPGFGSINPPATIRGPLSIKMDIGRTEFCDNGWTVVRNDSATISLGALSAFDCLSRTQVLSTIKGAVEVQATDGVDLINYSARPGSDIGANISVEFFAATPCALSARLEISSDQGVREQNVKTEDFYCQWRARARYCRSHPDAPPFSPEQDIYVRDQCGSVETRYRHIGGTARVLPPIVPVPGDLSSERMCPIAARYLPMIPKSLGLPQR